MQRSIQKMFAAVILFPLLGGCAITERDSNWHPPKEAFLWAETAEAGDAFKGFTGFNDSPQGTLYLYDVSNQRLLYTGWMESKQTLRLYSDHAVLLPPGAATQPSNNVDLDRWLIAQYPQGRHIKAYVMRWMQGEKK